MSTLWVLGALSVDEILPVPRTPTAGQSVVADEPVATLRAGGKGVAQALAAARAGAPVRLLGATGDDDAGRSLREGLARSGIHLDAVHTDAVHPTGRAVVLEDPDGVRTTVVVPGANAAVTPDAVRAALRAVEPGDVLLASLEVPASAVEAAVAAVADLDVRVVLDAAPFVRLPQHVLDRCEPVVVDESEAMTLADAGVLPPSLLVDFGPRGVSWNGVEVPAPAVRAEADRVGAGDRLVATLAARLAIGDTDEEALEAALRAAGSAPAAGDSRNFLPERP